MEHDSRDRSALAKQNIEITPEMVEAGRLALINWFEGEGDFPSGAVSVFSAMLPSAKLVDLSACSFAGGGKLADLG